MYVRQAALNTLMYLEPTSLAQHADAVVARLEDSYGQVREDAVDTLGTLEPATLAQYADALVVRLEDSKWSVRLAALYTLGKLGPATLAHHAKAVAARLEDSSFNVCRQALLTLGELEPATLALQAGAVIARCHYSVVWARQLAWNTFLERLPRAITRNIDLTSEDAHTVRSQLLGRVAWYRCRLRLRVRRIALYWYALPYRPSGPGHARDVEAWERMIEE